MTLFVRVALAAALLVLALGARPPAALAAAAQMAIVPTTAPPPIDGKLSDAWTALKPIDLELGRALHAPGARAAPKSTSPPTRRISTSRSMPSSATRSPPASAPTTSATAPTTRSRCCCGRAARAASATPSSPTRSARATSSRPRTRPSRRAGTRAARSAATATSSPCAFRSRSCAARASANWQAQFVRLNQRSLETDVWSHGAAAERPDRRRLRRHAERASASAAAARPRPRARAALYGLADAAAPSAGGNTSRLGADLSLPITATTSFFATLHPDFSNVEADQQTIFPTPFRRAIVDYRPFFAQASSFYNPFGLRRLPGRSASSTRPRSRPRATATRSRASRAASATPPSTRSARTAPTWPRW